MTFGMSPSRRSVLLLTPAILASTTLASTFARGQSADQIKLGAENFFLTLEPNSGSVMVDLFPFKETIKSVPDDKRAELAVALSRKVVALVMDELEAADQKALQKLEIAFVYATQRDEYNKPRAGGIQPIGKVMAELAEGKIKAVTPSGNYAF